MEEVFQIKVMYPDDPSGTTRFQTWIANTTDPLQAVALVRRDVGASYHLELAGTLPYEVARKKGLGPNQACPLIGKNRPWRTFQSVEFGTIDGANRREIYGWAIPTDRSDQGVDLHVIVDDQPPLPVCANAYRADLEAAGYGFGRHAFSVQLHGLSPMQPHTLQVMRLNGSHLKGSPLILRPSTKFDEEFQTQFAAIATDLSDAKEAVPRATFLAQQADRLLQIRADGHADRLSSTAKRQFRVRWTGQGPDPYREPKPRALVIDDVLPVANRDAGSCAIISHMHSLRRLGFEVVFAPSDMGGGQAATLLEAEGISCCCAPWCASVEEVLRRERHSFKLIYIHRISNVRYMPLVRHHQPSAKVVFSVADLQHLRVARQADVEQRPELTEASKQIRNSELSAARFADSVITHSTFEAVVLKESLPNANVHVVPWVVLPRPTVLPIEQRHGIAFIGSYGHLPNFDAAWRLTQELMPLVRARDPSIECLLVGSNMPDVLRGAVGPGIRPVGHVEDLASVFGKVRLTVAPLAFGAGIKGKVLDSLAAGIPCVCTPIAAEGLNWSSPLLNTVCGTDSAFADTIVRLHNDTEFNAECRNAGIHFIAENHSEKEVDARMLKALGHIKQPV